MQEDIIKKAGEIIAQNVRGVGCCTLSLIDLDGYPTSSTITASKSRGIEWVTFCTGLGGPKIDRIKKCSRASVCMNSLEYNITLVGDIEIVTEPDMKREMWYDGLENHFKGPEDPDFCVLRFTTRRYNLLVDWQEIRGTL